MPRIAFVILLTTLVAGHRIARSQPAAATPVPPAPTLASEPSPWRFGGGGGLQIRVPFGDESNPPTLTSLHAEVGSRVSPHVVALARADWSHLQREHSLETDGYDENQRLHVVALDALAHLELGRVMWLELGAGPAWVRDRTRTIGAPGGDRVEVENGFAIDAGAAFGVDVPLGGHLALIADARLRAALGSGSGIATLGANLGVAWR